MIVLTGCEMSTKYPGKCHDNSESIRKNTTITETLPYKTLPVHMAARNVSEWSVKVAKGILWMSVMSSLQSFPKFGDRSVGQVLASFLLRRRLGFVWCFPE